MPNDTQELQRIRSELDQLLAVLQIKGGSENTQIAEYIENILRED